MSYRDSLRKLGARSEAQALADLSLSAAVSVARRCQVMDGWTLPELAGSEISL